MPDSVTLRLKAGGVVTVMGATLSPNLKVGDEFDLRSDGKMLKAEATDIQLTGVGAGIGQEHRHIKADEI